MDKLKCFDCDEELVLEDFNRVCVDDTSEERVCFGFCPKCDKRYTWEERFERVSVSNLEVDD